VTRPRPPVLALVSALVVGALAACSQPAPVAAPGPTVTVAPSPTTPVPTPTAAQPPKTEHGTYAARAIDRRIYVWKGWAPDADPTWSFDTLNPVGEKLAMLVTGERTDDAGTDWVRVLMPIRPNEADGWVHADAVKLERMDQKIVVDLSTRTLDRYVGKRRVDRFHVGIGQPQWPTATGTFYVWAHVPQASPTGPYGAYALGLSGFSEVLKDWPGGGRMAIHGTPYASNLGQMVSHGCVRVLNPQILQLRKVPLGTPVIIRQ
jgi:lipoprotein-anchoring transpeptidase ErfK/SrfK